MHTVYVYRCPECGKKAEEYRHVDHRDDPAFCYHQREVKVGKKTITECDIVTMKRVFLPPLFTANRQCDMVENRIYHGDREDVRRQQKRDDELYEKATAGFDVEKPKYTSMDDILSTGVIDACRTKEGEMQWRAEHVKTEAPVNA